MWRTLSIGPLADLAVTGRSSVAERVVFCALVSAALNRVRRLFPAGCWEQRKININKKERRGFIYL
jgi:hypothetical protein